MLLNWYCIIHLDMGLTSEILCSVFWLMIEKFKLAKLIILNWRRKGIFVASGFVSFKYSFYSKNLEIVFKPACFMLNSLNYIDVSVLIDIWLDMKRQRLGFFFISHHFLPLSLIDGTYRIAIFSLQSIFCFNIDLDLKLMDSKIFKIQWASSSHS